MNNKKTLNSQMISLARDYRGVNQKTLSKKLKIGQGTLSKIENDILPVFENDELAKNICSVLSFPIDFFLSRINVHSFSTEAFFRKRKSSLVKKMLDAKLNIIKHNIDNLTKRLDITDFNIPHIICDDCNSPEDIANKIRSYFKVKNEPIGNLSKLLEDNGCLIYCDNFDNINGLTFYLQDRPVVYINNEYSLDNIRFTLAHELGHIVMHGKTIPSKELETEANRFSAEFLMPSNEIRKDFNNIVNLNDLNEYIGLKLKWKVSIQALIRKARDLNYLSEREYRNLNIKISRYGYRKKEPYPLDPSIETPTLLKEIFDIYCNDYNYSIKDIEKLLNLKSEDIMHCYNKYLPQEDLNLNKRPKLYMVE